MDYEQVLPDDEKPAVVTLKAGDLTAEEAEAVQRDLGERGRVPCHSCDSHLHACSSDADLNDKTPGKFRFRKPDRSVDSTARASTSTSFSRQHHSSTKRSRSGLQELDAGSSKSSRASDEEEAGRRQRQRQLLSFQDDDDDDDEAT